MKIRFFTLSDQQSVVQLWHDCGLVTSANNPFKDIQRKLKVQSKLFLVAVKNNKVIGTVMGGYEGHRGWINYLAVDPVHQKAGIGKTLMNKVEKELKKLGCPKINLQIRESNAKVRAFYEKIGYSQDKVVSYGKRLVKDKTPSSQPSPLEEEGVSHK